MSKGIFADTAPRYWAKGLPVIPLKVGDKMPAINGWQVFSTRMPSLSEQEYWLHQYAGCNIGLVCGQQSGLVMIDIDTKDPAITHVILEALTKKWPSPWKRVGAKGMVLAYRQPERGSIRTFQIKHAKKGEGEDSACIVEGLSTGRQVVLPPSIHPVTKMPYVADADLIDVLDDLRYLPVEIEGVLRGALQDAGVELSHSGWTKVTDYVAVGARDNQMTRVAGFWAQGVTRGELSLLDAIGRMHAWYDTCVEKTAGDDIDIQKGVSNLIGFLTRDVKERGKTLPKDWDAGIDDDMKKRLGLDFSIEHEEWSYDQLINYMGVEFAKHGAGTSGWLDTVTYVLERLSRSLSLDQMKQHAVMKYITECSAGKITIGVLNKRLGELKHGDIKGQDHTEIAMKVIEEVQQFGELRYHNDKFWQWGGSHWIEKDREELVKIVASSFGNLPAAKRRSDHTGIVQTIATLTRAELRSDTTNGVNFANGFLTEDLKLHDHHPSYGCTYTLPYRYLPEVADQGRRWNEFMERCWTHPEFGPDEDIVEKRMALQEAIAVTLFGLGTEYQRAILNFGRAGTGKSQVLRVVEGLLPAETRAALEPEKWGDKFGPATLTDKLLNIAGELSEKKKINAQWFKQIVSGESVNAQFKGQQLFKFKPYTTHWFASNHLPKSEDGTAGFHRRWLILTYWHPIRKEERITDIANIIVAEEREQIVAWAVQAMPRLRKQGEYTLPKSHEEQITTVANTNNTVRYFLTENPEVLLDPFGMEAKKSGLKTSRLTSETDLYHAYSAFCIGLAGVSRVSLMTFSAMMKDLASEMGINKVMRLGANKRTEAAWENVILVGGREK